MLSALLLGAAVLVLVGVPEPVRPEVLGDARPGRRPHRWAMLAAVPVLVVVGPVATVLLCAAGLAAVPLWRRHRLALLRGEERQGAVEALTVLASELRAGRSAASALEVAGDVAVGALGRALQSAAAAAAIGADPAAALRRAAPESAVPEVLRGLAACWQVCSGTGSSLAAAVERMTESQRAREEQRLAVDSELAGPRATAVLLAVLPLAGIGLAAGLGARPLHVLLHTPVGVACLAAGVGLDALGLWWTQRLVAAAGGSR